MSRNGTVRNACTRKKKEEKKGKLELLEGKIIQRGQLRQKHVYLIFDKVDQSITVGNDVTFMSQDDCVQLITLQ